MTSLDDCYVEVLGIATNESAVADLVYVMHGGGASEVRVANNMQTDDFSVSFKFDGKLFEYTRSSGDLAIAVACFNLKQMRRAQLDEHFSLVRK